MSDLIHRSQNVKVLMEDSSLPKWERLCRGLEALSGLELTPLPKDVTRPLEAHLVSINQVLARYTLVVDDDYDKIAEVDLNRMLDTLDKATAQATAAELDRIVAELDERSDKLPERALREAREHRDLMIPRLIEVLKATTAAARQGEKPEGNAHFFAIFLLTEFQAEEAFPVILAAFSLPGDLPSDLFGDALTSTLPRILAQFAADRPEVADALIRDANLNEYVRWEAAQYYVYLVRDGRLTRSEAVERLRQHLLWAMAEKDEVLTGEVISVLTSFAPAEALADITEAYRLGLVDEDIVNLSDVEDSIAGGETRVRQELKWCPQTGIGDTVEELRHWASFAEQPVSEPASPIPPEPHFGLVQEPEGPIAAPVASRGSHVGRNDSCPCGSGKKFKKCCGSRTQLE